MIWLSSLTEANLRSLEVIREICKEARNVPTVAFEAICVQIFDDLPFVALLMPIIQNYRIKAIFRGFLEGIPEDQRLRCKFPYPIMANSISTSDHLNVNYQDSN